MQRHRPEDADPWPAGPVLPRPYPMEQSWSEAIILHWRLPVAVAAAHMPPGVEPDVLDGSTWVGLIGFRMGSTRLGARVPVPYLGVSPEINVRLYSRAADGSRGVVFLSLDSPRLAVVLAARAAGIPHVWSRCRPTGSPGTGAELGYEARRHGGGLGSSCTVRPDTTRQVEDELSLLLTAQFGAHVRVAGHTEFLPVSHRPWPLHPAAPVDLEDELLGAAGVEVTGPPESVLFSPGVRTLFGTPSVVRAS